MIETELLLLTTAKALPEMHRRLLKRTRRARLTATEREAANRLLHECGRFLLVIRPGDIAELLYAAALLQEVEKILEAAHA